MDVKHKKYGFTMVELLTVLAIMAMLVGLLVPALNTVRNMAKEAKQKAQLSAIEMALMAFRNDFGYYPRSDNLAGDYCGAQKLAEALLGWDLMGFHPQSKWDASGSKYDSSDDNLKQRRGPYLEVATANAFTLRQLFANNDPTWVNEYGLDEDRFVLCDSFGVKRIPTRGKFVMAGTPILYYRANTTSKTMTGRKEDRIYCEFDNLGLCSMSPLRGNTPHVIGAEGVPDFFYSIDYKIIDRKIFEATGLAADGRGTLWPHRPDSYILITAGADGLYGTGDDICNF